VDHHLEYALESIDRILFELHTIQQRLDLASPCIVGVHYFYLAALLIAFRCIALRDL